jgi:hypothetical protein
MYVLIFCTAFVWYISHFKNIWAMLRSEMYVGVYVKHPLFVAYFNKIWVFAKYFRKNTQI